MKKVFSILAFSLVVLVSLNAAGNYYRYDFYDWALEFEASQAQLDSKFQRVGERNVAYLEGPRLDGQETIIMLHGFGASKENWLRYSAFFTDAYHVIALDLKGHGDSYSSPESSYRIADQVAFVEAFATSMGIKSFHLVGNSMGGAISALYAATYPDKVRSVTLISPAGVHDVPSQLDKQLEKGQNALIAKNEEEFHALLDFAMEQPPFIPAPIIRVEAEKAVSRVAMNELIFSHLRKDLESGLFNKLGDVRSPVLIIWGDQDRAIHVENIHKYAEIIPSAEKLVLEGVGHVAMIEVPKVAAQAMLSFISK